MTKSINLQTVAENKIQSPPPPLQYAAPGVEKQPPAPPASIAGEGCGIVVVAGGLVVAVFVGWIAVMALARGFTENTTYERAEYLWEGSFFLIGALIAAAVCFWVLRRIWRRLLRRP